MMMVPRSFQYGASPPPSLSQKHDKQQRRLPPRIFLHPAHTEAEAATNAMPTKRTNPKTSSSSNPSKPVEIPERTRSHVESATTPAKESQPPLHSIRQQPAVSARCREGVPASVAALLAMTTIPPHKRTVAARRRRTTASTAHISIEELVEYWKSDDTLRSSLASSPSMSILLEEPCSLPTEIMCRKRGDSTAPSFFRARSESTDSMPSLEEDRASLLSLRDPSTPESLNSRRSSNVKREWLRSTSFTEDCLLDHPLLTLPSPALETVQDDKEVFHAVRRPSTNSRSSFRSNLTVSLQALKNAALNSLSSLASSSSSSQSSSTGRAASSFSTSQNQIDDALWSHPFLFPRLSSEIRPTIQGTPTMAQRRYLNPMPLTFEEQEAPFQKALHAPYLAEAVEDAPLIQLQTYTRPRRRGTGRSRIAASSPQSEAGRAQQSSLGIRQREPRENADFLRVVVLEMNMRRAGKLETGRARIWLPPRLVSERAVEESRAEQAADKIPARWRGICA